MKKFIGLLATLTFTLLSASCGSKTTENDIAIINETKIQLIEKTIVQEETPQKTFASMKVKGLSAKDSEAFAQAMQNAGWAPQVTCMGNFCDIGTKEHFETPAKVVFISGHGYVSNENGYFEYSNLDTALHPNVIRSDLGTEYYYYPNEDVWSQTEEVPNIVSIHQKNNTDWLIVAACNQLRKDTRVSVFNAMNQPSEHPLKAVLGYGSYQGSSRDELVLQKFVALCTEGSGKKRAVHAWFSAHEAAAPTLAQRVRVAVRDGFQDDTLLGGSALSEQASTPIRLWSMERGDILIPATTELPETVAVAVPINATSTNTIDVMQSGVANPSDITASQEIVKTTVQANNQIPTDFQLYRTNSILETDMDGSNEVSMATLHTFARYINGIRVSVAPEQGEYLHVLMDGTDTAELDLEARFPSEINLDNALMANRSELLSKEEITEIGLQNNKRLQEEKNGYAPESLELKSLEPIYVVYPSDPQKLVLAWVVTDTDLVYVIVGARSGEYLYWSN